MNHQAISEICFEEVYLVPGDQTARRLFASLPHGSAYARHMVEALATGYLIAVLESICIRELVAHIDPSKESIVGTAVDIRHKAPVPAHAQLWLRGWVERIGAHDARFFVRVHDHREVVCDGTLRFSVVARVPFEEHIAFKRAHRPVTLLQAAQAPAPAYANAGPDDQPIRCPRESS